MSTLVSGPVFPWGLSHQGPGSGSCSVGLGTILSVRVRVQRMPGLCSGPELLPPASEPSPTLCLQVYFVSGQTTF